ncbi:MAG TPA: CDP-alcohol phosphatidyltransferase family protein [Gammaproteobacteria bacterium]|nr:CDP-alcohol phosphatidyltransferase family protein [Gammaproteobacteria bacterium]
MLLDVIISASTFVAVIIGVILYLLKLKTKGHETYERVERQGSSKLVSKSIMEMGYWWFQAPGEMLVTRSITPNQISWCSLAVGFFAGVFAAFGFFGIGAVLLFASAILDALDGYVARKKGELTPGGEILDSSLDRYVDFFFFAGLLIYYRDSTLFMLVTLFAMLGSFMISYSSAKAQAMRITPPRGSMKRSDRLVYLIAGGIIASFSVAFFETSLDSPPIGIPMLAVLTMIAVLSNISAIQRLKSLAVSADTQNSITHSEKQLETTAELTPDKS